MKASYFLIASVFFSFFLVSCDGMKGGKDISGPELSFANARITVEYGYSESCGLMFRNTGSEEFVPYDFATDPLKVKFICNPSGVVYVTGDGMLEFESEGTATVTAYVKDGPRTSMTVTSTITPYEIEFDPSEGRMNIGETMTLNLCFRKKGESQFEPYDFTDDRLRVSLSSDAEEIATVDGFGRVKALKGGDAVIEAYTFNGESATFRLKVAVPTPKLRVMQFNILQGKNEPEGHDWANHRKQPCIAMVNDLQPDIVCLEEARKKQCEDLENALVSYGQIKFPKDGNEANGGQRNAIMYRKDKIELLSWGKYWFSEDYLPTHPDKTGKHPFGDTLTTDKMTIYGQFKLKESGKVFWVFGAHYFANCVYGSSRQKCVEITKAKIQEYAPEQDPVFFCGDLNMIPTDGRFKIFDGFLTNSCPPEMFVPEHRTFNGFDPYGVYAGQDNVIDFIYYRNAVNKGYHIVVTDTVKEDGTYPYGEAYLSDHYPIYTDFEIPLGE